VVEGRDSDDDTVVRFLSIGIGIANRRTLCNADRLRNRLGLLRILQASSEWTQQQLLRLLPNYVAVVAAGMSTVRRRGSYRRTGARIARFQTAIA
jgi:hypothetical protein